ncbi:hypothetical protein K525DRAFT_153640, partial [Schizophyllum commune Loenen D]
MPRPTHNWTHSAANSLITEQLNYNADAERQSAITALHNVRANVEQHAVVAAVLSCVRTHRPACFFVDGPGGTGKTFVYNTIAHALRADRRIVLCSASSGISAILLRGGRTAHSTFKIPILNLCDTSTCSFSKKSARADLMRATDVII